MVVLVALAILAAVAWPAYHRYVVRARVAEGFDRAQPAQRAVAEYRDHWGVFPHDNAAAGLLPPEQYATRYVQRMEVMDGAVAVFFAADSVGEAGEPLALLLRPIGQPSSTGQALGWVCQTQSGPEGSVVAPVPQSVRLLSAGALPAACGN